MTMFNHYEDDPQLDMILKDYKDHESKYVKIDAADTPGPGMEYLIWAKPGTCVGFVSYLAIGNSLIVRGDYGEAIYMVTDHQPIQFWANCGLTYLKEKCRASEGGSGSKWNDWSERECLSRIDEMVKEYWAESGESMPYAYEGYLEDWRGSACTRQDYEMFVMRNDDVFQKLLGDYWMDYGVYSLGDVAPIRLKLHWAGLKLAWAAVKDTAKTAPGYWDDVPEYPASDWKYEIANGDTRQSYKQWVAAKRREATEDN